MKISTFVFWILLPLSLFYSQPLVEVSFTVSDGSGEEIVLRTGLDSTATDSIDEHLDEYELPPLPPTGIFDIRINLDRTNGVLSDYRQVSFSDSSIITKEYFLSAQLGEFSDTLTINYDITSALEFIVLNLAGEPLSDTLESGTGTVTLTENLTSFVLNVKYVNPLGITSVNNWDERGVNDFYLYQNYPNPFNPSTVISFRLSASLNPSQGGTLIPVTLKIYDLLGREVATLVNEEKPAGNFEYQFNASDYILSSGIYFYKLKAGEFTDVKKFILLK